jgi:pimeloyl-ACP methyl ester carboxylesterase
VLALHGYSNNSSLFTELAAYLRPQCTTLAIDLPGHGHTRWEEDDALTYNALRNLVETICHDYNVGKISLLGFSLGGRVALSILKAIPERIHSLTLLAPDGLHTHPALSYTNNSWLGRFILRDVHKTPARYQRLLQLMHRRRVVTEGVYQFLQYHLNQTSLNSTFKISGLALRKLYPKPEQFRKVFASYPVPVHLIMGTEDPVIPIRHGTAFAARFPKQVQLHPVRKGHRLLTEEVFPLIKQTLIQPSPSVPWF